MAPDSRPRQTDHDLIRDWIAKPGTDRPPVDEILPSAFRLALEVLAAEFAARPAQAPSCPAVARDHVESACDEVRDRLVTALGYKLRILAMRSHGETTPALSDGRIDAALSDTASQVLLFSLVASCGEVVATPLAEFLLDRVAWCLARGIRKGFDDLEDDRRSCWVRCCAESIRGVRKFEYRTLLEALSYFRRVCLRGTRGCETPPPLTRRPTTTTSASP